MISYPFSVASVAPKLSDGVDMLGYRFAYFATNDVEAAKLAASMLEEGRTYDIDKRWSVRVDRTHANAEATHSHVRLNNRDVAVIHDNGTPSHNSDPSKVPGWVRDWIRKKGLTEEYFGSTQSMSLDGVPTAIVAEAIRIEGTLTRAGAILSRLQRD